MSESASDLRVRAAPCVPTPRGCARGETKRAGVILIFALLMSCDQQRISELEEGVSTEAAVRKRFAEPAAIYQEPNGDITLEYPRQPAAT